MGKFRHQRVVERRFWSDSLKSRHHVGVHRDAYDVARHLQISMRAHERRRILIVVEIASEGGMHNADCEILMHLEMQVRRIKSVRVSYGADLLSPAHWLALGNQNLV